MNMKNPASKQRDILKWLDYNYHIICIKQEN